MYLKCLSVHLEHLFYIQARLYRLSALFDYKINNCWSSGALLHAESSQGANPQRCYTLLSQTRKFATIIIISAENNWIINIAVEWKWKM